MIIIHFFYQLGLSIPPGVFVKYFLNLYFKSLDSNLLTWIFPAHIVISSENLRDPLCQRVHSLPIMLLPPQVGVLSVSQLSLMPSMSLFCGSEECLSLRGGRGTHPLMTLFYSYPMASSLPSQCNWYAPL